MESKHKTVLFYVLDSNSIYLHSGLDPYFKNAGVYWLNTCCDCDILNYYDTQHAHYCFKMWMIENNI